MANNRIYLRCKCCGETFYLGKHFVTPFCYHNYHPENGSLEDQLNEFYEKHYFCGEYPDPYPIERFEIEYEDPPEE